MRRILDTIKGRLVLILVVNVILAHVFGLWLYVKRSEAAIELLYDTLVAERIALMVKLVDATPVDDRARIMVAVSLPMETVETAPQQSSMERSAAARSHVIGHLLGSFLNRSGDNGILVELSEDDDLASDQTMPIIRAIISHLREHHRAATPLAQIDRIGLLRAEIKLSDGSWLKVSAPILTATSFFSMNLVLAIAAMTLSAIAIAAWVLRRWTQPLTVFAAAAQRLGDNIHAPPLPERGLYEVRTAAHAFNLMQERIRRLVEDRTALAAAIAHDLGTPITRLRLRADDIANAGVRGKMLADLEQMRRMVTGTLEFARSTSDAGTSERFDLASLLQSICDTFADAGDDVVLTGPDHLVVTSEPVSLWRVFTNLIDNAVKYGGRASITLAERRDDVEIIVQDDGPGIPEHLHEAAFRPFSRLIAQEHINGTGLGLTVAGSIVLRLGGEISLANAAGGGLAVTVRLPRRPEKGRAAA
jgi:signal transduction histidine kinase